MIIRKNILPKTRSDICCCLFTLIFIPFLYWFELYVVVPTYYELWSLWYTTHFILGTIVLINVISNLVALILCDTSIRGRLMPSEMKPGWRFCAVCETVAPPRSWHCDTCNICILKRDHHCMFSGCCVGHYNSRYFLNFILYAEIALVYSTYFNLFFISSYVNLASVITWVKLVFPLASLVFDTSFSQLYLLSFLMIIISLLFTSFLFWFHMTLVLNGQVTHDRNVKYNMYDMGYLNNLKLVLGERWYLSWISVCIYSKLPQDGINWKTIETTKNR